MTLENKAWENLKAEYLDKVEKALSSVKHPDMAEVLEDVQSHLDQRFAELKPDEQTNKNLKDIIAEMGPTAEYAELLEPGVIPPNQKVKSKYLLWIGLVAVVCAVAILPKVIAPKVGYIITFRAVELFEPQTAKELLDVFNENHPRGIRTHHYRTRIRGHKLEGLICVDNKYARDEIVNMIDKSEKLSLFGYRAVTQKELEKHYRTSQVSLRAKNMESEKPPMVVSTWPAAFANDVSSDLHEITVTFDQPMMNLSWSWVGGGDTFPEKTGEPRYDKSKTTCSLPVKLEPGKFYWVGINSPQYRYFQTDMGIAAQPYVILFATKDKDGNPTAIPENYLEEAIEINSSR